jgi:hypothetical protein
MVACLSKTVVFVVNLIFLLIGLGVLIFGIIVLAAPTTALNGLSSLPAITGVSYIIDVQQVLVSGGIVLTVVGSVIVLITFIGLLGTCGEGQCMLATYVSLLLLTILFELGVVIYSSVDYNWMQSRVQNMMLTSLKANFQPIGIAGPSLENSTSPAAVAWETMQFEYACCGALGYEDYATFDWQGGSSYLNTSALVPPSCCMQIVQYQIPSSTANFVDLTSCMYQAPQYTNTQGCYVPMMAKIVGHKYVVTVIFASLVAVEIIVLMLSMHLIGDRGKTGGVYA